MTGFVINLLEKIWWKAVVTQFGASLHLFGWAEKNNE
jgi:hypothetical protein